MINTIIDNDLNEIKDRVKEAEFFQNKSFLVTGGAGFLGSWICNSLIRFGASVTCQDNFSSGLKANIDHLVKNEKFSFFEGDIRNITPETSFDGIFHFASRASPDDYNIHQVETLLTNAEGMKNVLDLAQKNDCFCLYSSTSEIYGDAKVIPTPEQYWGNVNSLGERSCYDEGKRYGEALCMSYKREYKTKIKIVRIFNTFGPRIRPDGPYGRALSRFVLQALNNEDIVIYGDGKQTRSFCYVTDTVSGILSFAALGTNVDVINIGNEKELTINDLAKIIIKKTNSKSKIIHKEKMPDDPKRRKPDISLARKVLKWEPKTTFDLGLKKTIDWISENKDSFSELKC